MKLVVDMNLSPKWVPLFGNAGWQAIHWSGVGPARTIDPDILAWAKANGYVVFTQDLDFGGHLMVSQAVAPSVVLLRCQDTRPAAIGTRVIGVLRQFEGLLQAGALLVIEDQRVRLRPLPLTP
jgi:predicted nuclease of predicted toxin-antitoxin system